MPSVAIVGAGLSGLAAAHTFADAGYTVTIFEKSAKVGGRAATRERQGFIYDHGAQYVKEGTPSSLALIKERFYSPDLIDIQKPIWIFDGQGHIQAGDASQNQEQKLNYRHGLHILAHQMAAGLLIQRETCITRIQQESNGWRLINQAGHAYGSFDALLITIPAPQASTLIKASQLESAIQDTISTHLDTAHYNPLISVMLGYRPTPHTHPYYALVNTDKQHPISWLAWEHEKAPERVPAGTGLLLAQMAPAYSAQHMHSSDEEIVHAVAQLVAGLIQEKVTEPIFSDVKRWTYALPSQKANGDLLNASTLPHHLAFAGDAFVGGRLHLALEHGITVSNQIIASQHLRRNSAST
jgi:renalase